MGGLGDLRVLLVDDNKHMSTIVTTVLSSIGVRRIRSAEDGMVALQVLREWTPDVAIVDFQMEPMDGVEFTKAVRGSGGSTISYLPIVMLTGHSERSRVLEARDAGVTEFVAKPLSARALLERLEAVIYHARPFVSAPTYFGPDRRRRSDPNYSGPLRRAADCQ